MAKVKEKICCRCKQSKPENKFPKDHRTGKRRNPCHRCLYLYRKTEVNKEKRAAISRRFHLKHKNDPKYKARIYRKEKKRRIKNIERFREKERVYGRRQIKDLTDTYVKTLILCKNGKRLKGVEVPPALIELKRQQIILKRTIDEKTKNSG